LTSLAVPDISSLTTLGNNFMEYYAYNDTSLTSLDVPDTSAITRVGTYFMAQYAYGCTGLTSLAVPDTSALTYAGNYFLWYYANNCRSLTSLAIPDTTALTSNGGLFMSNYAANCTGLDYFVMDAAPGWFAANNVNWTVPAAATTDEEGLKAIVPAEHLEAWQVLTATGKTLALNRITDPANVVAAEPKAGAPGSGDLDGDGLVTISEAVSVVGYILSGGELSAEQIAAADIDGDGTLTMADVVLMVRLAAGL
ncbi:MAG: dockerin type I domain-containing protein, partial [Clostridiales Family XIII bacterium]|nr:dockerin type I domain-containing protein [Clostridiales Family XIII bacterium]